MYQMRNTTDAIQDSDHSGEDCEQALRPLRSSFAFWHLQTKLISVSYLAVEALRNMSLQSLRTQGKAAMRARWVQGWTDEALRDCKSILELEPANKAGPLCSLSHSACCMDLARYSTAGEMGARTGSRVLLGWRAEGACSLGPPDAFKLKPAGW